MGAIGMDTPVQELDLAEESVRRELCAMFPSIARFPLRAGGLPPARWFEQFDEEDPDEPLSVADLLAHATFTLTSGRELQIHGSREPCFDHGWQGRRPDRGLLVIELRFDNWVVVATLKRPGRVFELAEGRLSTFVDPGFDVTRWGARPRTRRWLRSVYLEWHLDRRLEMPVTFEQLRRALSWEERLETLFPVDALDVPGAADLEGPGGPGRWAERRWEAVTGEELPIGPPRWPAGPEEEERELLIGALSDYARGAVAAAS